MRSAAAAILVTLCVSCTVRDVPTGSWYQLSPSALGDGAALDTYAGDPPNEAFIGDTCCSGSAWRIAPPSGDEYQLSNQYLGVSRVLETYPDGHKVFMGDWADITAQRWKIMRRGDGMLRITNAMLGPDQALDVRPEPLEPFMNTVADVPGQKWMIQ